VWIVQSGEYIHEKTKVMDVIPEGDEGRAPLKKLVV